MISERNRASANRVAIVTGGSRGIGRAVARKLATTDYAVVINYINRHREADAAVEEILAANGTAVAVRADVADELDVERLFCETIEAFGGADVVVHAAARMILGTVVGYDLETFDGCTELTPGGPSWSTSRHRFSCGMAARS